MIKIRKNKRRINNAESHELLQRLNKEILVNHALFKQVITKELRLNLKNRTRKSLSETKEKIHKRISFNYFR